MFSIFEQHNSSTLAELQKLLTFWHGQNYFWAYVAQKGAIRKFQKFAVVTARCFLGLRVLQKLLHLIPFLLRFSCFLFFVFCELQYYYRYNMQPRQAYILSPQCHPPNPRHKLELSPRKTQKTKKSEAYYAKSQTSMPTSLEELQLTLVKSQGPMT